MASVLIVDDEVDLARLLEFNLKQAGLFTQLTHTGAAALEVIQSGHPDMVLLDLMLPDMSGVELCRTIKSNPKTQGILVVMLTAKAEEADRVMGFESGADDYVVKPFSVRELSLRLKAILRRTRALPDAGSKPDRTVGDVTLDLTARRCSIKGQEVALTFLEFRLLQHLMEHVGRVQPREKLLEQVWEVSSALETRTVDTHVMRLREKLGPARHYLETVRGVGYRLSVPE